MKNQVRPHAQIGEGYNNHILSDYLIGLVVCNQNFVKKIKSAHGGVGGWGGEACFFLFLKISPYHFFQSCQQSGAILNLPQNLM